MKNTIRFSALTLLVLAGCVQPISKPRPSQRPTLAPPPLPQIAAAKARAVAPRPWNTPFAWVNVGNIPLRGNDHYILYWWQEALGSNSPSVLLTTNEFATLTTPAHAPFVSGVTRVKDGLEGPLSNLVRVPTTNGIVVIVSASTNLVWSTNVTGPWSRTNSSVTYTNPTGRMFFRTYGKTNTSLHIETQRR